jgi:hypothetical protein
MHRGRIRRGHHRARLNLVARRRPGRSVEPQDVAGLSVHVMSDEASSITEPRSRQAFITPDRPGAAAEVFAKRRM